MHRISIDQVKDELATSNERFINELGLRPDLFAYPYGEYNLNVIEAVKEAGFIAAFGQNSGIMHKDDLMFELPRFAFNETYGDIKRLALAANGLPLKVTQITPADMVITQNPPFYGFTLDEDMEPKKQLRCFSSRYGKLDVSLIGQRAEIRLPDRLMGRALESTAQCRHEMADGAGLDASSSHVKIEVRPDRSRKYQSDSARS